MRPTFQPNFDGIKELMQSAGVRAKLREIADVGASSARSIDPENDIQVTEGTRPRGRPYARVSADASREFGTSRQERIRALGRVFNV